MTFLVTLACGHEALQENEPHEGGYVSCWALMYPEEGCQAQVRVESVVPAESGQLVLFPHLPSVRSERARPSKLPAA